MSASDWDGILREDETILWQGQPDGGLFIERSRIVAFATGAFFFVVGVVMLVSALREGTPEGIAITAVFAAFGLAFALSQSWWQSYKRRHTFYTLTSQRAILGIALPGRARSLKTFEIASGGRYEYHEGAPGSVVFDYQRSWVNVNNRPQYYAAGFMRTHEAAKVWDMVQALQGDMRREGAA